jgi:hypothetical protein
VLEVEGFAGAVVAVVAVEVVVGFAGEVAGAVVADIAGVDFVFPHPPVQTCAYASHVF